MKKIAFILISLSLAISVAAQNDSTSLSDQKKNGKAAAQEFTEAGTPYTMQIRHGKDYFIATYDAEGIMRNSTSKVYGGQLPVLVTETLQKLQGWDIQKSVQTTSYNGKNTITNIYKLTLHKGRKNKTLFLNSNGEITNNRLQHINRTTALARF